MGILGKQLIKLVDIQYISFVVISVVDNFFQMPLLKNCFGNGITVLVTELCV